MHTPIPPEQGPTTGQAFFLYFFQFFSVFVFLIFLPTALTVDGTIVMPADYLRGFSAILLMGGGALGAGSALSRLISPSIPVTWYGGAEVAPYSTGRDIHWSERIHRRYSRTRWAFIFAGCALLYLAGLSLLIP